MKRPKSRQFLIQSRQKELEEIQLLESWIEFGRPDSGSNPLSAQPLPPDAAVGRLGDNSFSLYAGCGNFEQLPVSERTKKGLGEWKYKKMTDIQRASLPHALCGRDILGAAKTGSGKTLAFIIPVLEKLYRARWGHEDGVGSIIISPTRELAVQIFQVLKNVGKHHCFSAGALTGGNDVDTEKERVNELNILICTPGRLLQHMDETPNFDCSQLQILVLDEADRILDMAFKKDVNAIISQLPKQRQTLLFSATQTKSVQDLARLSLKDPEYLSVHEESVTATPTRLHQTAITVTLDQKLDMLWSFFKAHLKSRILVFLSSSKQVKFVFETFKKLRPGIPLKCLYGRMKQDKRMGIYSEFCEKRSVLFSTDVAARGLDFNKGVDWVVQVDCPEDVSTYIHRVGRTARFNTLGKSLIFLMPSEIKMLEKLHDMKIPIRLIKANTKKLQPVSALLAALLAKYENLRDLAQRAFITYIKSIYIKKDKEIFDVMKLPIEEFSASLGLPMTPRIRFLKNKVKGKKVHELPGDDDGDNMLEPSRETSITKDLEEETDHGDVFLTKEIQDEEKQKATEIGDIPPTRVLKKKKLKINLHRPVGTRIVFDEKCNKLPPLATLADLQTDGDLVLLDKDSVKRRYEALREELKMEDKEDKLLDRKRRKEKRVKQKLKGKKGEIEESGVEGEEGVSECDESSRKEPGNKRKKIYFDDDDDVERKRGKDDTTIKVDSISLAEQEELALKLLGSLHSSTI